MKGGRGHHSATADKKHSSERDQGRQIECYLVDGAHQRDNPSTIAARPVPLGVVSVYFIIIQPIVIGSYCSLCLLAALAMVVMIPFALDELVTTGQYLIQSHRRGESLVRTFVMGGASPDSGQDNNPDFGASWSGMAISAVRGVTSPWTLTASALLGIWLMFSRLVLGAEPPLADSDHLVGALAFTVAVIAMAEVGRALRFINVLFGAWLVAAPWLLAGGSRMSAVAGVAAGLVLVALSLPRAHGSREHYGRWIATSSELARPRLASGTYVPPRFDPHAFDRPRCYREREKMNGFHNAERTNTPQFEIRLVVLQTYLIQH